MQRDLTFGNPLKLILYLCIPQIFSAILQQLYTSVDALIVGNFVGPPALAGVGLSQPIAFLISAFMIGMGGGVSVIVGQYFGGKDYDDMKKTISTSIISLLIITLIISVIAVSYTDDILYLINTPKEVFDYASVYMKIFIGGSIFTLLYNLYSGILRAVGDAKSPLIFLAVAAFLNVILDILFVVYFKMGTAGAAIATVVSQGISSIFCIIYIKRKVPIVSLKLNEYKMYFDKFKLILKYGIPSSIQMSIIALGNIALQNLLNTYGVDAIAGYTSAIRIDSFVVMPYINIGVALSSYSGQNMGAREFERIRQGLFSAFKVLLFITLVLTPLVWIFSRQLVGIFLQSSASKSIEIGTMMLRDLAPFYILLGLMNNTNGTLRGAGDNTFALLGSVVSIGTRIIAAYLLNDYLGVRAVWISQAIGRSFGFIFIYLRYHSGRWKNKGIKIHKQKKRNKEL